MIRSLVSLKSLKLKQTIVFFSYYKIISNIPFCINALNIIWLKETQKNYHAMICLLYTIGIQITARIAVTAYPVARKSFSLRRKTITKHRQMKNFFWATGFELCYAVIALYFINLSLSFPKNYLNDLTWHNQHIIYLPFLDGRTPDQIMFNDSMMIINRKNKKLWFSLCN